MITAAALAGCSGGDGALGDHCASHDDCDATLQCIEETCVARCFRGPDCGDGFACSEAGICLLAEGQTGDACTSEVDCSPGLACQIDGDAIDGTGTLLSSCSDPETGRPAGSTCADDTQCRNGTCALGRCVDLCTDTRDCAAGTSCVTIPRARGAEDADPYRWATFQGCLPTRGTITFPLKAPGIEGSVHVPVPSSAQQVSLVMAVDDANQKVGAQYAYDPDGQEIFSRCQGTGVCDPEDELDWLTGLDVRHQPGYGQSVFAMPSQPSVPLKTGMFELVVGSRRPNGTLGTAIPRLTAVVRLDSAVILDLHFHFLDLTDHPCHQALGGMQLSSSTAAQESFFQSDYLGALRSIFSRGGVALGTITYDDILDHPELDGLDVRDSAALLSLGKSTSGIDVFFVRSLSPVGVQGLAPGPGPAGVPGTRQSGVVVGMDTLCYRKWDELARLTAHELARFMGLYRNIEVFGGFSDPLTDTSADENDPAVEQNLMFYSELGGTSLSPQQRDILLRSPVLR